MNKLIVAAVAAVLVGSVPALVLAQTPGQPASPTATPGVDKRQANQQKRIEQGAKSGQLNEKEQARLAKGQARVDTAKDKAAADGKVTKQERKAIHNMQDKQSARIAKQKHDQQKAKTN